MVYAIRYTVVDRITSLLAEADRYIKIRANDVFLTTPRMPRTIECGSLLPTPRELDEEVSERPLVIASN